MYCYLPITINKIRAVKRLYGGIASRSILICRHKPKPEILEKCYDLGIDLFYDKDIKGLAARLENLLLKMEL